VRGLGLPIVIVTNNIVDEQKQKLALTGLEAHVDVLVTSEEAGIAKPAPEIFEGALARVGVPAEAAVMLGDAWSTDIAGALAAGIRPVWLNRFGLTSPDLSVETIDSLEPTEAVARKIVRS
jgi:FMN phosphatase YigB (HAD superfamily)